MWGKEREIAEPHGIASCAQDVHGTRANTVNNRQRRYGIAASSALSLARRSVQGGIEALPHASLALCATTFDKRHGPTAVGQKA
jgi:hypothetical protein